MKRQTLKDFAKQQIDLALKNEPVGCLIWTHTLNENGYGRVRIAGKETFVHRLSLEMKLGRPIEENHETGHICRNRACYNPAHLYEATYKQNAEDRFRDKTACPFLGPRRNNKTGYKGVVWIERVKKFRAYTRAFGKSVALGYYDTVLAAALAVDAANLTLWGESVYTNVIKPDSNLWRLLTQ